MSTKKPKRNKSAYYYFCEYMKPKIINKYQDAPVQLILAELWKTLPEYEKKIYLDMAADDKKRYEFELSLLTD